MRTKTYSVPSESDGEIEISSKSNSDCEELKSAPFTPQSKDKDSPVTSPDENMVDTVNKPPIGAFWFSPKVSPDKGSSQYDPIDIDDRKPHEEKHDTPARTNNTRWGFFKRGVARKTGTKNFEDTESEEEGPDVMPIEYPTKNVTSEPNQISEILNYKPTAARKEDNAEEHATAQRRSVSASPTREVIERVVMETQARVAKDEARASTAVSSSFERRSTPDNSYMSPKEICVAVAGSEDDEAAESEQEQDESVEDYDEAEFNAMEQRDRLGSENDEEEDGRDKFFDGEINEKIEEREEYDQDLDEDFPIDPSEADDLEEAALAGQNAMNPKPKADSFTDSGMIEPEPHPTARYTLRTPSPSDAALAKDFNGVRSKAHPRISNILEFKKFRQGMEASNLRPSQSTEQYWQDWKGVDSSPGNVNNDYTTGPFALKEDANLSSTSGPAGVCAYPTYHGEYQGFDKFTRKPPMSIAFALNKAHEEHWDALNHLEKPEELYWGTLQRENKTAVKAAEDHSSKLHISNLVNSQHAEPVRSNKRKASEISAGLEDIEFDTAYSSLPVISQETPLPDAQPRDQPIVTETETSMSLGETVKLPTLGSFTPVSDPETPQTEGPARKKAKTASSTGRGIGKFLLGVGVGVVGVAAAFLASIPVEVQEEVRLGLS